MKRKSDPTAWRNTSTGSAAYTAARAEAQSKANATGHDHGLEANDLFKSWHTFMLPARQYRNGHELRCEVVSPERLDSCATGHGPR